MRRILSRHGYRGNYTCPRCLHRMVIADKALIQVDGRYGIKYVLHCPNCGYEETRIE
ncbi:hypothetical protein [Vulcanisaeta sp. JCM 16159]|uniref:hypothetical protein n=1 Tax=Vulcanisaeta sp. JCM 16159 TaxID=1295371 RepID=UPI000AB7E5EF|nr:hypothetical protein [Vulcanisaeta sp. JCM 16159]